MGESPPAQRDRGVEALLLCACGHWVLQQRMWVRGLQRTPCSPPGLGELWVLAGASRGCRQPGIFKKGELL